MRQNGLASALPWHSMSAASVLEALESRETGLSPLEARGRLGKYGRNVLVARQRESVFTIAANQFRSIVVLLLIAAIGLSWWGGERAQAIAISAVLLLNVSLGFYTEFRAREAIRALLNLDIHSATVVRDNRSEAIDAADLVPGDVILCEAGEAVPADARLLHSTDLETIEAPLTGESEPTAKVYDALLDPSDSLPDRRTMLYKGSFIASGVARAVVTGTGIETEIGHVQKLVESVGAQRAPLEKQLDSLGSRLAGIAMVIGALMAALVFYRGASMAAVLQIGIAIAVSSVPEGLPAVVIISMAIAAHRMARKYAVVRRLPSVETLGSVTVVCTDKTGTLTAGKPAVTVMWVADREMKVGESGFPDPNDAQLRDALLTATLANRSEIAIADSGKSDRGDPYEVALLKAASSAGLNHPSLLRQWPLKGTVPFSSARMMMASFHESASGEMEAFVKGAHHKIIDLCDRFAAGNGGTDAMSALWRTRIEDTAEALAARGLRVLALARGPVAHAEERALRNLEFVGLVGMTDPVAPGVPETIAALRTAGIRTVMLTGDHGETARAVAAQVGIDSAPGHLLTGAEIDVATDDDLTERAASFSIASRVSPEGKLRLLSALQRRGEIVAMLGDGINDAAALKKANIGVAMGLRGTDVAKDVAGIVLGNDDFNVIAVAVQEGRVVFHNIRKFVFYLFSCNMGEIVALFTAVVIGLPMPMTAMQILWMNLVTDSVTALSLAGEKPESTVMSRPPRRPGASLLSGRMMRLMSAYAVLIGLVTVAALAWGMNEWPDDIARAVTLSFTTLAIAQIFHLGNARHTGHVMSGTVARANRYAIGAVILALALQVVAVVVPPVMHILNTRTLTVRGWLVAFVLGAVPAVAGQTWKWWRSRRTT